MRSSAAAAEDGGGEGRSGGAVAWEPAAMVGQIHAESGSPSAGSGSSPLNMVSPVLPARRRRPTTGKEERMATVATVWASTGGTAAGEANSAPDGARSPCDGGSNDWRSTGRAARPATVKPSTARWQWCVASGGRRGGGSARQAEASIVAVVAAG